MQTQGTADRTTVTKPIGTDSPRGASKRGSLRLAGIVAALSFGLADVALAQKATGLHNKNGDVDGPLFFSDSVRIRRADADGKNDEVIYKKTGLSSYIRTSDVTMRFGGRLYWIERAQVNGHSTIFSSDLSGRMVRTEVTGWFYLDKVKIDNCNGRLYWIDGAQQKIMYGELDASGQVISVLPVLSINQANAKIADLLIDPYSGKMYWTRAAEQELWEANLDGTDSQMVFNLGLTNILMEIALGELGNSVYYSLRELNGIDGELHRFDITTGSHVLLANAAHHFRGLAVDQSNQKLLWGLWGTTKGLVRSDLNGQGVQDLHKSGPNSISLLPGPTGESDGWEQLWESEGTPNMDGYQLLYTGDFDGDGAEEILGVSHPPGVANVWMTVFKWDGTDWQWLSTNGGDPSKDDGIYPYRYGLIVGDFDGDGKDEVLGGTDINDPMMEMFSFGDVGGGYKGWTQIWDTTGFYGGNGLLDYRTGLLAGDFNGDGRDELLGGTDSTNGWMAMLRFEPVIWDWSWQWSTQGDPSVGDGIYDYRNNLLVGDFDSDGRDEVLGFAGWATMFHFDADKDFHWGYSNGNYDPNWLGSWGYPLDPGDVVLAGNIDYTDDHEEILLLQRGPQAKWAMTQDFDTFDGQPEEGWRNHGDPPFVGDWPLATTLLLGEPEYLLVKADAAAPEYLLAYRPSPCGGRLMKMYRISDNSIDY